MKTVRGKQGTLSLFLVTTLAVLAACNGVALKNTQWVLVSLYGEDPLEGTEITLHLEDWRVTGSDGCNEYGGEYKATRSGSFSIDEIWRTLLPCDRPEGIMTQADTYRQALTRAASYQLADDQLTFKDDAGGTILLFSRQDH